MHDAPCGLHSELPNSSTESSLTFHAVMNVARSGCCAEARTTHSASAVAVIACADGSGGEDERRRSESGVLKSVFLDENWVFNLTVWRNSSW
jgi:hypothetical protein